MDIRDLYWAAGFLEAEGCFQTTGVTPTISASQRQRQLLDRLSILFGGRVLFYLRKSPDKDIYVWAIHDHRAIGIMLTLFSVLSPSRQKSINNSVETGEVITIIIIAISHNVRMAILSLVTIFINNLMEDVFAVSANELD